MADHCNMHGEITGGGTRIAFIDTQVHGLLAVPFEENRVHEGYAFFGTDYDASIATAAPKYYRITTPNTTLWSHLRIEAAALTAGLIELYETPTENEPAGAGTGITLRNVDRNSSRTATVVLKYDPTFAADGTLIWFARLEAAAAPHGNSVPIILGQNKTYVIKFTSDANDNKLWLNCIFVEHTNLS